jgi:hypothetical protein
MNTTDARLRQSILEELAFSPSVHDHMRNPGQSAQDWMKQSMRKIIGFLRQASPHPQGPLGALDFRWEDSKKKSCTWTVLMNSMRNMDPDDGLFMMQCLMRNLPARKSVLHDLRSVVLAQESWRLDAIALQPDLFNAKATRSSSFLLRFTMNEGNKRDSWRGNPFVLLAALSNTRSDKESVLKCLRALESAGASLPGKNPEKGHNVLHKAAMDGGGSGAAHALAAFAEHFQNLLNDKDMQGFTPLHQAAISNDPEKAIALIQAGADTQALGLMGDSPLDEAVKMKDRPMVEAMLFHGEHDWTTIRRAKSWSQSSEISAILNAKLARMSLEKVMSQVKALGISP